ncbi:MAG: hypothetical protein ACI8P7_001158 [Candidatus Azotimanducaceae bacterium]|jgi:hypothetical protein
MKMNKIAIVLAFVFGISTTTRADEGMWIPLLLGQLNEAEMQAMGMEITAEDVYAANHSSLKDAIVHFGGGCTGEMISSQGLLLTNHHCGYGQIQSHSSVENDYLTDGFWAMDRSEELSNPGLTASFIKSIIDVTADVQNAVSDNMTEADRKAAIDAITKKIIEAEEEKTGYGAYIRSFFKGNQYFMFVTETFTDVRLVGAPPSSIGKYGADTDNWVWPRHTGDFSMFRVYADKNNKPAAYSEDNVPYAPAHHLPVSLEGINKGDFTLIYGFPGRTDEYLPAVAVDQTMSVLNPARIAIRDAALQVMDKEMRQNDLVRIQYAAKFASIANYWKKWIGENTGLKATGAIDKKLAMEAEFTKRVNANEAWEARYGNLLHDYDVLYGEIEELALARDYFLETCFRATDMLRYSFTFRAFVDAKSNESIGMALDKLKRGTNNFYKNFNAGVDQEMFAVLMEKYINDLDIEQVPVSLRYLYRNRFVGGNNPAKTLYKNSIFSSQEKLDAVLARGHKAASFAIKNDPAYKLMADMYAFYRGDIYPAYYAVQDQLDSLGRLYMEAQMTVFPEKRFYPDANSTLRVAYGNVKGYAPKDGMDYHFQTYLEGVMEKYVPGDYEFDLPSKLIELYQTEDYGQYADASGRMPVCYIASNHTTGGNSGSPCLNGKGELIGLNFDRAWEGTMSDINYDVSLCRNIMVDIRYVLFIVDKFAGAGYLIDEMQLVTESLEAVEESAEK